MKEDDDGDDDDGDNKDNDRYPILATMAAKDNKRKRDTVEGGRPSKKAAAGAGAGAGASAISVRFPTLQHELHPVVGMSMAARRLVKTWPACYTR